MKNIVVFSHEFPPFGGGAGVVAKQYCKVLSEMGHNVTLVTRTQKSYDLPVCIKVVGVPHIPKIWFLPYLFFINKMKLYKQDIILLNDMASAYIAGVLFDDKVLSKSYTLLHGSEPEMIYKEPSLFFKLTMFSSFYSRVINKVKGVIAVSYYMKEKFLKETPFNNKEKIKVIYAGLDNCFFLQEHKNKQKIDKLKDIILTVSRIEKAKGFDDMYDIFKRLIKLSNTYVWNIVGDGNYLEEFRSKVKAEGYDDRISFYGKVKRNKLASFYKNADVFLLLSQYKESFGLVYLEAQAFGCPAIGLNQYGVIEAIQNGKTGFLVQDEEECLAVLLNKKYKELDDFNHFLSKFTPNSLKNKLNEEIIC